MTRPASKRFLEGLRSSRDIGSQPATAPAPQTPGKITLEQIRAEVLRVYGERFKHTSEGIGARHEFTIELDKDRGALRFLGRSKAAARRLAYETLRRLPSAEVKP